MSKQVKPQRVVVVSKTGKISLEAMQLIKNGFGSKVRTEIVSRTGIFASAKGLSILVAQQPRKTKVLVFQHEMTEAAFGILGEIKPMGTRVYTIQQTDKGLTLTRFKFNITTNILKTNNIKIGGVQVNKIAALAGR